MTRPLLAPPKLRKITEAAQSNSFLKSEIYTGWSENGLEVVNDLGHETERRDGERKEEGERRQKRKYVTRIPDESVQLGYSVETFGET